MNVLTATPAGGGPVFAIAGLALLAGLLFLAFAPIAVMAVRLVRLRFGNRFRPGAQAFLEGSPA